MLQYITLHHMIWKETHHSIALKIYALNTKSGLALLLGEIYNDNVIAGPSVHLNITITYRNNITRFMD